MTFGEARTSDLAYVLSDEVGEGGGISLATLLLCEGLVDTGWKVRLFATCRVRSSARKRLESRGIGVRVCLMPAGWRWGLPSKVTAVQLLGAVRRAQPAFIHIVGLSLLAEYVLISIRNVPIYVWETSEGLPSPYVHRRIARHLNRCAAVLAPSATVANNIRTTYSYRGPMELLPFWVEPPAYRTSPRMGPRTHNVLYVGRLAAEKGLSDLLEAFRRARETEPELSLTIRGKGEVDWLHRLAADLDRVDIAGYATHEEYIHLLDRCDVVVLPSLSEGYPLALLEACAHFRPIIATTVGSIPETFKDRPCAVLTPPGDPDALAAALVQLSAESDAMYVARCLDAGGFYQKVSGKAIVAQRLRSLYRPVH